MINGVVITPLRQISDERGAVMHMLRRDWPVFSDFVSSKVGISITGWF